MSKNIDTCINYKEIYPRIKINKKEIYFVGTKGVSQNHLLSFDDNKVLKLSIGYAKHFFKCTGS